MKRPILKLSAGIAVMLFSCLLLLNSCRKNTSDYVTPAEQWNNSEMTNATFMGQIIKEDGSPLDGATVSTGSHQIMTDADGFFYFSKISTPKKATLIKVEKGGYFNAFRTLEVIPNQDNHTTIMVMSLPNAVSLNAVAGGNVAITNGGSIDFPANAIVDAATNVPYTGNVSVYAKWIDPSGANLDLLIPGALRGINTEGGEQGLTTYGMQAVELVGSAGQKLQLGNGQLAALKFPLPSGMAGSAPSTVPLWHFDEQKGMWIEDGVAVKNGAEYVGTVSHFSFWNCDYGGPIVNFTCQLVDASNNPISGAYVRIVPTSSTLTARTAMTNSTGTVTGGIPANASFNLEYIPSGCNWSSPATFIQTFSSVTSNINLGTIVVSNSFNAAVVSGVVEDCSNVILANAPVKLKVGSLILSSMTDAAGAFSFNVNCLTGATSIDITAYDVANAVNGSVNTTISPTSTINVGTVQACGTLNAFITWSSNDGTTTTNGSLLEANNSASFYQSYQGTNTYITANDSTPTTAQYISFTFDGPQTVAGTHTLISHIDHLDLSTSQTVSGTPIVTLTNYQVVGGWIEGSYTATITSPTTPSRTVICNFRVKRLM